MPDGQPTTKLSTDFNQAAPKIVKLKDLQIQLDAFSQINDLNFVEKLVMKAELNAVGKKSMDAKGQGLYVDTQKPSLFNLYVDSKFIDDTLADILKDPKLTEKQREGLKKLDGTIDQAINACPDQSDRLKQGKIKPVAPKP